MEPFRKNVYISYRNAQELGEAEEIAAGYAARGYKTVVRQSLLTSVDVSKADRQVTHLTFAQARAHLQRVNATAEAQFMRMHKDAILPARASAGSAGYDLYARLDVPITLWLHAPALIPIGWACKPPAGCFMSIRERSSLGGRGIKLGAGVVDEDFRGEIKVVLMLLNRDIGAYVINPGDRVAQAIFQPYVIAKAVEVATLEVSERGAKGFGSSGR